MTVPHHLKASPWVHRAAAAALLVEHRAYRALSAKFFSDHMAGRLIGDSRHWLNHASLRRAGFTVVVLGRSVDAHSTSPTA